MDPRKLRQRQEKPDFGFSSLAPPLKRSYPDNRASIPSEQLDIRATTSNNLKERTSEYWNRENGVSNFTSDSAFQHRASGPLEGDSVVKSEPLGLPFMTYQISKDNVKFSQFIDRWRSATRYAFCLVYIPQHGIDTSMSRDGVVKKGDMEVQNEECDPRGLFDSARASMPEEDVMFLPESQKPIGLVVAWDRARCYFISLFRRGEGKEDKDWVKYRLEAIKEILEMPNTEKVLYDCKPHLKILMNWNIFVRHGLRDPRIAAWILEPDTYKDVSLRILVDNSSDGSLGMVSEKQILKKKMPLDSMKHAIRASLLLAHQSLFVINHLESELRLSSQFELFVDVEMKLLPILAKMEFYGVGFSQSTLLQARGQLEAKIKNLEDRALKITKRPDFDMNSPSEVSYMLFEHLKLPFPSLDGGVSKGFTAGVLQKPTSSNSTPSLPSIPSSDHTSTSKTEWTAAPTRIKRVERSTKAEILHAMNSTPHPHPLPSIVLEHRMLSHAINTYLDPLPQFAFHSKKLNMTRIYATCHQTCVPTGRLAYDHPNLQSIRHSFEFVPVKREKGEGEVEPRMKNILLDSGDEHVRVGQSSSSSEESGGGSLGTPLGTPVEVNIRDSFVAQEGMTLVSFDYCQLELRIMAHYANEEELLKQLSDPKEDMFNVIAGQWLCKPPLEVTPDERVQAKHICYGILYGMGNEALSRLLKVTIAQAKDFKKAFQSRFHGLTSFLKQVILDTRLLGYTKTLGNRRRHFPDIYKNENAQNRQERSDYARAVRQITNTICQGSAADIIKIATVKIEEMLNKEAPEGRCIINLHDELVYELPSHLLHFLIPSIQSIMQSIFPLRLPLPVRIFYGPSWGHLSPFLPSQS